jgi:hypothetical protein
MNMVKCPSCGCELWIIGDLGFCCFLCRMAFVGKSLLSNPDSHYINRRLSKILDEEGDNFKRFFGGSHG